MISDSISSLPQDLQGLFWANIGLIGGNVKFKGFGSRLCVASSPTCVLFHILLSRRRELRALAPVTYAIGVYESNE